MNGQDEIFFSLAENLPDAYTILQDEKVLYVNSAAIKITGYSYEELKGQHFGIVIAPEELPRVAKFYEERLRGLPVPAKYTSMLLTKSGARVPVEVSVRLINWEGRPATSVLLRDITERIESEAIISRHINEATALNKLSHIIGSTLEIEEVLSIALDKAMEVVKAEAAEVWLREGDTLIAKKQKGLRLECFEEITQIKIGEGVPGLVAKSGKYMLIPNLKENRLFLRKKVLEAGYTSMLSIPLLVPDSQTIGVMDLFMIEYKTFTTQDISFVETVTQTLAIAVKNALLYSENRRRLKEI